MATIKELCSCIPASILRDQAALELKRRKMRSYVNSVNAYAKRMDTLKHEERVANKCAQKRPQSGRVYNCASSEEIGRIGNIVVGIRTGAHRVVVCKTRKKF